MIVYLIIYETDADTFEDGDSDSDKGCNDYNGDLLSCSLFAHLVFQTLES